ncbi:hypothetical protein BGX21_000214 [Mortierella sp. AD011]|nr:hypothetical protein BGX20_000054 [Mortierella sp. AD010]KAF9401899.1 hypothetical protein BGX21_000214 [Mortierella sp. AD011]
MVAISNLSILLLGTLAMLASGTTTPAKLTKKQMAQVVDCQVQCIYSKPPFGNKPDFRVDQFMRVKSYGKMPYLVKNMQPIVDPCHDKFVTFHKNITKITEKNFNEYVLCDSKTLTKNENVYYAKNFNYKKAGFSKKEWSVFRNHTVPGFRRALHNCRGGCRRVHVAHKKVHFQG